MSYRIDIVVSGMIGSGKSVIIEKISSLLEDNGYCVFCGPNKPTEEVINMELMHGDCVVISEVVTK